MGSSYHWVGGSLSSPSSWAPQPDPPADPHQPDSTDFVTIGGGGTLTGSIFVAQARLSGSFDLTGSISVVSSGSAILDDGSLTIEAGASFGGGGVSVGLSGVASVTQIGGSVTANNFSLVVQGDSDYALQGGSMSTVSAEILGQTGAAFFTQTGGTNTAALMLFNSGTYQLDSGLLSITGATGFGEYVGDTTGLSAAFTQTGGTNTINGTFLSLGFAGTGTYDLQGGSLSSAQDYIGQNSTGTFTQTGGSNTVSDRIVLGINLAGAGAPIGTGTYVLGGTGSLSVQTVFIGSDPNCIGTFTWNNAETDTASLTISGTGGFPGLIVGGEGIGKFEMGHGTLSTTLQVGRRTTGDGTLLMHRGTFNSTDESVGSLGKGTFVQKGGTNSVTGNGLNVGTAATATGTYELNKGLLSANKETIGDAGKGAVKQTDGFNDLTGNLVIGNAANATGSYRIEGAGKLDVGGNMTLGAQADSTGSFVLKTAKPAAVTVDSNHTLTIGDAGTGTFYQNGATLTAKMVLGAQTSGNGSFTLKSGNISSKNETIGKSGTGAFDQSGGKNIVTGTLAMATLANSHATYALKAGELSAWSQTIGDHGTATLTQTGGSNKVAGQGDSMLVLGSHSDGNGTYDFNIGTLKADGEIIGDSGTGTFDHSSGTNTITRKDLIVGNASGGTGTYNLHQGMVEVQKGDLRVGAEANSTGTFNFNPNGGDSATLKVDEGNLTIGDLGSGTFTQAGGELDSGFIVASQSGSDGTFTFSGGTIKATDADEIIGDAGTGTFTQTKGSNQISNGALLVGNSAGGDGTYNLGGNSKLIITGGELSIAVGGSSTGTFNYNPHPGDKAKLTIDTKLITVGVHGNASFVQGGGSINAKVVVGGQVGAHGTYDLFDGSITSLGQTIGNNGTGTLTQYDGSNKINGGGDLMVGAFSLGNGTYHLVDGKLAAGGELIGYAGTGLFKQEGGSNKIAGPISILDLGVKASGNGTYELDGGTLASIRETVGDAGVGTFTQTASSNKVSGDGAVLNIGAQHGGNGTYNLQGGSLAAPNETIGDAGTGSFHQTDGSNKATTKLDLGAQNGGNGTYLLDDGTLAGKLEIVGDAGIGTFMQTGGTNKVSGTGAKIALGAQAGGNGTYELSGGTLTAAVEIVGDFGTGLFKLTGGTDKVTGTGAKLDIGAHKGGHGTYQLDSGTLSAVVELVGDAGSGALTQGGGSNKLSGAGTKLDLGAQKTGHGNYELDAGSLSAVVEIVGDAGTGAFVQKGGTNKIAGTGSELDVGAQASGHGSYELDLGTLTATLEKVGLAGTGSFVESGGANKVGTLNIGTLTTGHGSYALNGGTLSADSEIVGDAGTGAFTQATGTTNKIATQLTVGAKMTSHATYQFGSGSTLAATIEVIGDAGTGALTQTGGTNKIAGTGNKLVLGSQKTGHGSYELDSGAALSATVEMIGDRGAGSFTHAGGSNKIASELDIGVQFGGRGSYALSGAASLIAPLEIVGDAGIGTISQTGGSNKIVGAGTKLDLGAQASGQGTYDLHSGSMTTTTEFIGDAGMGTFNQSGGTNQVTGVLTIGNASGSNGIYTLTGGTLTVLPHNGQDDFITLAVQAGSSGTLNVSGGTAGTPKLVIGAGGIATAGTGGVIAIATQVELHAGSTLDSHLGAVDIGSGLSPTAGTIQVGQKGHLTGAGTVIGDVVEASKGDIEAQGGTLRLNGAVSGGGKLLIDDGAILAFGDSNSNTVKFLGAAGTLEIADPAGFSGRILGLQQGDVIHLSDTAVTDVSLKGHVLKVTDDHADQFVFNVSGALSGFKFVSADDGLGGSNLTLIEKHNGAHVADAHLLSVAIDTHIINTTTMDAPPMGDFLG